MSNLSDEEIKKMGDDIIGRKLDAEKLRWDLLPFDVLEDVVKILHHGALKYAPENWRLVAGGKYRYTAALLRHLAAWRKGEMVDPDSGLDHIAHVACNALFLIYFDKKEREGR